MNLGNSKKVISLCLLAALTTTTLGTHAFASGPGKVPEDVGKERNVSAPSLNIRGSVQQRGHGQNAIGNNVEQTRGSAPAVASGRPSSSGSVGITGDVDQEGNGQNAVGSSVTQIDEVTASERLWNRTLGFVAANPRTAAAAGIAALAVLVFAVKNADGIANLMRSFQGTPKG